MTGPIARSAGVKGVRLGYWEWRGAPGNHEPPLFFAHATGFHARVFDAIIEHFPGRRAISIDLHGHGRSEGGPISNWGLVAQEVAGLLGQLGIRRAVGVGHSMGAHVLAQCAAEMPEAFSRLVLFDPVIMEPEYYASGNPLFTADAPHPAIRRKRDFASVEAMIERFRSREPYSLFAPRVFEDYCRHALAPRPDGAGYELACAPETEASVYSSSTSNGAIHEAVTRIAAPTLVVRARRTEVRDFKGSPTWPLLADAIPQGTDLPRPDRTHFHPLEDPDDAAAIIRQAMAG
ncbi:MAG: alpha/beta hydrolase [Erythrobacter sp.]|jgi:pimeloyl-ACP methyl ester carboxylesterase|nr:alpha/beta hydrolase [Erythrobacter sp.]